MPLTHVVCQKGIDTEEQAIAQFWKNQEKSRGPRRGDPRDHMDVLGCEKTTLGYKISYAVKLPKSQPVKATVATPVQVHQSIVVAADLPNEKDCGACRAWNPTKEDCADGARPGTCPNRPQLKAERQAAVKAQEETAKPLPAGAPPKKAVPAKRSEPLPAKIMIPLDLIVITGENPRSMMDGEQLQGLIDSIKEVGQREPVNVRPLLDGHYELFSGHRRILALKELGRAEAWAVIEEIDEKDRKLLMGVHNLNREDLAPTDLARWLDDTLREHPELSQAKLASICGHQQAWVANHLRLLKAPEELQLMIISQEITPAHVQILLPIAGKPEYDKVLALMKENIRENGEITVRRLQHLIDGLRSERDPAAVVARSRLPAEADEAGSLAGEEAAAEEGPAADPEVKTHKCRNMSCLAQALPGSSFCEEHQAKGKKKEESGPVWTCRLAEHCRTIKCHPDGTEDVMEMLRHLCDRVLFDNPLDKEHEGALRRVARSIREGGDTWKLLQKLFSKEG